LKPSNILFDKDPQVFDPMHEKKMREGSMTVTLRYPSQAPAALDRSVSPAQVRYKSPAGLVLKLCDFGLSRRVPDVKYYRETGDIFKVPFTQLTGTEAYISPEMFECRHYGKGTWIACDSMLS
jgi:serine/threonine protein kinase